MDRPGSGELRPGSLPEGDGTQEKKSQAGAWRSQGPSLSLGPLGRVQRSLLAGEAVVAGVLSGTSADGIDVVLARFPPLEPSGGSEDPGDLVLGPPRMLAFETAPFPAELGARVRAVLDGGSPSLAEIARLQRDLGRAFGRAARRLAETSGLLLDLAGSHGQTVYHHDGNEPSGPATLQLGDGDAFAAEAGCATVSDFRAADVAAGGEGAPLSALADPVLFRGVPLPAAILNLGGMANLTLLDASGVLALAFDTGPANSLLDGLARRFLGAPFDRDGARAARGRVHPALLAELLAHPYFERAPPKSTGRDTFGERYVGELAARAAQLGLSDPADLLATAVAAIAQSIAHALERFAPGPIERLVLAGGGARNRSLVSALQARCGCPVVSSQELGVDPDAREALVFALLAVRCALGIPASDPRASGARRGAILGKLSFPAPASR